MMRGIIGQTILVRVVLALAVSTSAASAQSVRWQKFDIPETGASVDIPRSVFTEVGAKPDGYGQSFRTADGRADLTVQSMSNGGRDTPALFLAKKHPPSRIVYQRITPRFFVVSSFKDNKIWYDRCNFASRYIHCVLINYPASEKRDWDGIVTRISNTLTGG
jgi:hypothetical protein